MYSKTSIQWAVRLSWLENVIIHAHFFRRAILNCEVGQTDLVFGVRSGFISRSAHTILQVSVCSEITICYTLVNIQTHTWTAFD